MNPRTTTGLDYIRNAYGVPAYLEVRVRYTGHSQGPKMGTITGARDAHLLVRMDGEAHPAPYHPTWELEYLP